MNTNRIKQALAEGKAIYCKTYGEARQLFEVMGWNPCEYYCTVQYDFDRPCGVCYVADADRGWNGFSIDNPPAQVIPFTALTRSRLAECLGVEDDQPFIFRGHKYRTDRTPSDVWSVYTFDGEWSNALVNAETIFDMLAHPEEIKPYPRWSEDSVMRAAALLACGLESLRRTAGAARGLYVSDGVSEARLRSDVFPEIQPGATVKLEDIK